MVIVPVILSGGSGTRLWPKSRLHYPKQLHNLFGDDTMLQHTVKRVLYLDKPIVVCNEEQRFMVADQLNEVCPEMPDIILEPVGRNTAPAIALAALQARQRDENAILVVLPADHLIKNEEAFRNALNQAIGLAAKNKLVTFGVTPLHPETGYGYIKASDFDEWNNASVLEFVEKPNRRMAQEYLSCENYFWNSGMFVFAAKQYLAELSDYEPDMLEVCTQAYEGAQKDLDFLRIDKSIFASCPSDSIDYAVMERTENAWLVPLDAGWSDVGSWESLWQVLHKDHNNNAIIGDVIVQDCQDCLFHSEGRLVAGIGLENVVVVDTSDGLLIVNKNRSQDVKVLVDELKQKGRSEFAVHREVYRPWGSYGSLASGDRYQVKLLTVKPGASLSLQMHHHRAEHWVVVKGTALVQRGEEEVLLSENESIYIPLGEKHRLTNPGKLLLELIEVQSGCYLGEDDIIRFEDIYKRN